MSAFISAADKHTAKKRGENDHVEYTWSNDLSEKIVQFYFQLVRTKDMTSLENQLSTMLGIIKGNEDKYLNELCMLYKIMGNTRDIEEGKGEYSLSFMQIYVWYQFYPTLAKDMIIYFVSNYTVGEKMVKPMGSWKDLKYLCNYIAGRDDLLKDSVLSPGDQDGDFETPMNHDLFKFIICLYKNVINHEWDIYQTSRQLDTQSAEYKEFVNNKFTLACKWVPREKSKKFGWINKYIAYEIFGDKFLNTSKTESSMTRARLKCIINLRKRLSAINKAIDTAQIKMCSREWRNLNFNRVTSLTLRKNKLAIQNVNKNKQQRSNDIDRISCAVKYKSHLEASVTDSTKKIHGKKCNVYELVKDALTSVTEISKQTVNQQWVSNSENNNGLGNIIAVVDTSSSMECDDCIPLYNAIGMGIRITEKASETFRDRFITFNDRPQWVQLNPKSTFCEKVQHVRRAPWGGSTNFELTMKLILDICLENDLPPNAIEDLVLAIFSDMQMNSAMQGSNDTVMENIKRKFSEAGLRSKYRTPFKVPHILFWNLRKTDGFPTLSTEQNVTMLSGYNPVLLNVFCEKGFDELKNVTPLAMLKNLLDKERYTVFDNQVTNYLKDTQ